MTDKKIKGLDLQVASDAKTIAHWESLLKDHRSNSLCVTLENCKLQKGLNELEVVACVAVVSAERLQADLSSTTGKRDALGAKCKKFGPEG